VSQIILNYYGVIQLKKMVTVLGTAMDLSMQRKEIAEAKFSLGSGSRLMLLQSTVDLNADSNSLIQEKTILENTKAGLNRLLARDPSTPFEINDSIVLAESLPYDHLVKEALNQNSQLIAARFNEDLSRLGIKESQSDRYPKLGFQAAYNFNYLTSQTGFLEFNQSYGPSFGFNLTYNLFNGFNTNRNIRNAKIDYDYSQKELLDVDLRVRTNLLTLYNQYVSNLASVKLETINQEVAKENVDVAFEKYKLGALNDIDLRDIQNKFIDAQSQLLQAQFQAKQAEVELMVLSGQIFKSLKQ
jgi:outer membrane protein TolC